MVSISVVIAVAVLAFLLGVFAARRSSREKVIWEAPPSGAAHDAAIADPQFRNFLEQKETIAAIKRYRELTGLGLKESKDAVDAFQRSLARP